MPAFSLCIFFVMRYVMYIVARLHIMASVLPAVMGSMFIFHNVPMRMEKRMGRWYSMKPDAPPENRNLPMLM